MLKKKFGPIFKELYNFLSKKLSLSYLKYGFGIRDLRSGIREKPIPDPGVIKAPDPWSGSATLEYTVPEGFHLLLQLALLFHHREKGFPVIDKSCQFYN